MSTLPAAKLDKMIERWQSVQDELNRGAANQQAFARLSKEFAELDPLVAAIEELRRTEQEEADLATMIADAGTDREMKAMAEDEIAAVKGRIADLEDRLRILMLPKDAADERSAILEVRAGTGGDEAALFAADLFRMYQRYAEKRGWKVEIISMSENDLGGYKEIVASITGAGVFARLKFESGVHRVQRVPATEASGRIHTSAATVAVLPEAEEVDIDMRQEDLRIDRMRAGGAGGQHVNKTESAIRVTHIPTGMIVVSAEKNQHQNLRLAMQVMRSRLFEMERNRVDSERAAARRDQVGSGDRSQRIRTYNFPQSRVTDHRINLTLHSLAEVMAGDGLDEIVDALTTDRQASLLAQLGI